MRYYELSCCISSELSEKELRDVAEKITSLIQSEEGILAQIGNPIRQRLGSPIKKEDYVFLLTLNFQLNPEKLKSLEKKLKSIPEILRFLVLHKKLEKKVEILPERIPLKAKVLARTSDRRKPLKPREEKVELEEIEKKLEEILGET
jgi:ribosomal protein S6